MRENLLTQLIAPSIVGIITTIFAYRLNKHDPDKKTLGNIYFSPLSC
ncbi:type I toxin-antitoxin system Fst family toxin [Listeria ilorinensis]